MISKLFQEGKLLEYVVFLLHLLATETVYYL